MMDQCVFTINITYRGKYVEKDNTNTDVAIIIYAVAVIGFFIVDCYPFIAMSQTMANVVRHSWFLSIKATICQYTRIYSLLDNGHQCIYCICITTVVYRKLVL